MVRLTFKWNLVLFFYFCLIIKINSLPITNVLHKLDTDFKITELSASSEDNSNIAARKEAEDEASNVKRNKTSVNSSIQEKAITIEEEEQENDKTRDILNRNSVVRPGQDVTKYVISITRDGNNLNARAVLTIEVTTETRLQPIRLHCEDLNIQSVQVGIFSDVNANNAEFFAFDGVLTIIPAQMGTVYVAIIEYTMPLRNDRSGIFISQTNDVEYIAMNLHPINARRVFPCVDEPNVLSTVVFSFTGFEHNSIVSNSQLEDGDDIQFMPLQGPLHTWGMVSHNLININLPVANVLLYVRSEILGQDQQASTVINFLFTNLNTWTGKPYFEIILNQEEQLHIFALPDTDRDWYALSTICLWEPYVLMESNHAVRQRTTALVAIADAVSRQWFGYAVYPENFRFQWVITGLGKYAAFEILKSFQTDPTGNDVNLIDMNTIFTTEIIQESLLRDSYSSSQAMQPAQNVFSEPAIRDVVNGLIKYKAPAIMHMFRNVLGDEDQNFIQSAARALFNRNPLLWVNAMNFYDAINSKWLFEGNEIVPEIPLFAEPWVELRGYPLVHVGLRQGGLLLTQEHFSFTPTVRGNFLIPITYTTRTAANFDNFHPVMMLDVTTTLTMELDPEDYVLFNIQGQGYYRVNYDVELWQRIIEALYDEELREQIHPLNRATLIDDSLILARASKLDYEIAFEVVLAMELEQEYAPWKAFVRNMDFLRKHLLVYVEQEDLDPDIYLRMVRRTIETFEEEIGFDPEPNLNVPAMISLTRGLVMDHACRANYDPCIAAAVDWFYNPNDNEEVNPNIPHEIRPAVYCTMVREGDEDVIEALKERMEIEPTQYERIVIMEAFACSEDEDFIQELLLSTIAEDSPYGPEERFRIFNAIVNSNFENTNAALAFLTRNTNEIRQKFGGPDKLEDLLFVLADNIVDPVQLEQFVNWINSVNSNLGESLDVAMRARDQALEIMTWRDVHLEEIYEWIDENDAHTIIVSSILIFLSLCVTLFNN